MATDATHDRDAAHVVLLGASNVTLGFPRIVAEVRRLFPGRIQIFAAHGHGRSYGQSSWAPFRTLPGLRACRLWDALKAVRDEMRSREEQVPLHALVTDIGNDLLYGANPEQIDEWVAECLSRLEAEQATVMVGRPPVHALGHTGPTRFLAMRSFFFPNSPLTWERMLADVPRLDELIAARAERLGAMTYSPRPEWYGFDPIHIRSRSRAAAWREILGRWLPEAAQAGNLREDSVRRRHWLLQPAERTIRGAVRTRGQPVFRWEDGGGIWLY